ncbi:MAG: fumarylacetoacetate hydrolase family protein [Pseudomonadota bacterium]
MSRWVRFEYEDKIRIGLLAGDNIEIFRGNIFSSPVSVDDEVPLEAVQLLTPVSPKNFLGLWNNFRERAEKDNLDIPEHPLYFTKTNGCQLPSGGIIVRPPGYTGDIMYEAELGIVIGQHCYQVSELAAANFIFGYTCVNDIMAADWLNFGSAFTQWTRAKSAPTFGPIGPVVSTNLDFENARAVTRINGKVCQDYPLSDMIFNPEKIVSAISQDMELHPGDLISCGTSLGVGPIPAGAEVEIEIDGIGILRNTLAE